MQHQGEYEQWAEEQLQLKSRLCTEDPEWLELICRNNFKGLKYVAGVDISFYPTPPEPSSKPHTQHAVAAFVILSFPELRVVHKALECVTLNKPYVPSFLAFREAPPLCTLIERELPIFWATQNEIPSPLIVLVDGNGILHPRGFGLASHLGVMADISTIGCSKNFYGLGWDDEHESEWKNYRTTQKNQWRDRLMHSGSWLPLVGSRSKETWGAVVRSGKNSTSFNPIFVSIGHRISLKTAVEIVIQCSNEYRVPEPIRVADIASREYIREHPR